MSEFSTPTDPLAAHFDPCEIEARLNALVGNCSVGDKTEHIEEEPDLLQQFLADESLDYLETRSSYTNAQEDHNTITVIQLYRIAVLPNQSRLVIHPSFRPDLPVAPSIEATSIDRDARIRVTRVAQFGARLEINLADVESSPSQCCIEIICSAAETTQTTDIEVEK